MANITKKQLEEKLKEAESELNKAKNEVALLQANNQQGTRERPQRNHAPDSRPPRKPMSSGGKLHAEQREGYQRYWQVVTPRNQGILDRMIEAYWEHVTDEDGAPVTYPIDKDSAHYLMEIPQQYYDEDMARQQKDREVLMQAISDPDRNQYVPKGQSRALETISEELY